MPPGMGMGMGMGMNMNNEVSYRAFCNEVSYRAGVVIQSLLKVRIGIRTRWAGEH